MDLQDVIAHNLESLRGGPKTEELVRRQILALVETQRERSLLIASLRRRVERAGASDESASMAEELRQAEGIYAEDDRVLKDFLRHRLLPDELRQHRRLAKPVGGWGAGV